MLHLNKVFPDCGKSFQSHYTTLDVIQCYNTAIILFLENEIGNKP